jgi:hypothetical protein
MEVARQSATRMVRKQQTCQKSSKVFVRKPSRRGMKLCVCPAIAREVDVMHCALCSALSSLLDQNVITWYNLCVLIGKPIYGDTSGYTPTYEMASYNGNSGAQPTHMNHL